MKTLSILARLLTACALPYHFLRVLVGARAEAMRVAAVPAHEREGADAV